MVSIRNNLIKHPKPILAKFMERILIYHTAAIGDSILGTPVSVCLKKTFPEAKITQLVHGTVQPLLALCPGIDELISMSDDKSSILDVRDRIAKCKPQLIVDLSGSGKSMGNTAFLANTILRYKKQEKEMHAVDNYLATIKSICDVSAEEKFPTIFPSEENKDKVRKMLPQIGRRFLALVPGVGAHRPHRAWPEDNWVTLAKNILWEKDHALVLIGGMEERTLCSRIAEKIGEYCYNFAGKLSLVETATLLSLCDGTVSGDTGPAHLSIAVGTSVVGLYGPTLTERSGPYGCSELALSVSDKCKCLARKSCAYSDGSGVCMKDIPMKVVYGNLISLFPWNRR